MLSFVDFDANLGCQCVTAIFDFQHYATKSSFGLGFLDISAVREEIFDLQICDLFAQI